MNVPSAACKHNLQLNALPKVPQSVVFTVESDKDSTVESEDNPIADRKGNPKVTPQENASVCASTYDISTVASEILSFVTMDNATRNIDTTLNQNGEEGKLNNNVNLEGIDLVFSADCRVIDDNKKVGSFHHVGNK